MSTEKTKFPLVGQSVPDPDALEKATGILLFSDDILMAGMLHGRVLRSPYADAASAESMFARPKRSPACGPS